MQAQLVKQIKVLDGVIWVDSESSATLVYDINTMLLIDVLYEYETRRKILTQPHNGSQFIETVSTEYVYLEEKDKRGYN